jgi:hypothetical protein
MGNCAALTENQIRPIELPVWRLSSLACLDQHRNRRNPGWGSLAGVSRDHSPYKVGQFDNCVSRGAGIVLACFDDLLQLPGRAASAAGFFYDSVLNL